ncbi:MAG: 4Fe-4S binding protein [Desulfobacteraceae bacterium]|jgi:Pyruvate/2-oxoacid:ferredoxin oxidoreductase delta subunit
MTDDVYKTLCQALARRPGRYQGLDIPEFYTLARELFTPEEAAACAAQPRGLHPAGEIAQILGKDEAEVAAVLEAMARKGLCFTMTREGQAHYAPLPLVPGIFEYQFMRGTFTDHDRRIARLVREFKQAYDAAQGVPKEAFPSTRVIPVDRKIEAKNRIHTYDQVLSYIDDYDDIAVSTCYCRHQARLIDENDHCGNPDEVCLQFGQGAQFVIDRGMGRRIEKAEARDILERCEEAGLVHSTVNRQDIDWLCNCCACHCVLLKTALATPRPGLFMNSGFQPVVDPDLCTACGTCVDRCPTQAMAMTDEDLPSSDPDRCIGCGVCATGCPEDAIALEERPGFLPPPENRRAYREALKANR